MKRVHVFVTGNVQGVSFRATTKQQADEYNVNGWVRNLPDNRVEAVFEGDAEAVDALMAFCQHGPEHAQVESITVDEEDPKGLDSFIIRR